MVTIFLVSLETNFMILQHSRKMDGSRILKLFNITQINNLRETEQVAPKLEQHRTTTVH